MKSIIVIATAVLLSSCKYWNHSPECKQYVIINSIDTIELEDRITPKDSFMMSLKAGQVFKAQGWGNTYKCKVLKNSPKDRKIFISYPPYGWEWDIGKEEGLYEYSAKGFDNVVFIN